MKPYFYLSDTVYETNPQTIAELKRAITARSRIRTISVEECVRVIDNFAHRLQVCNAVEDIWSIFWKGHKTKTV